jgi:LysR family nitrogen assimilation transcriptional regulator
MEIRQLKYFVTIVELGSVSAAARKLHIAQPALSQQVANLEKDLDVQLLCRTTQGVTATEPGVVLYRHAQALLRHVACIRHDVLAPLNAPAGPVSLGIPPSAATMLTLPVLKRVRALFPGIHLEIHEDFSNVLRRELLGGRLDIAILFDAGNDERLSTLPLLQEELYYVASPAAAGATGDVTLADIAQESFILPNRQHASRQFIERAFLQHGAALHVHIDLDSLERVKEAVEMGLGSTILPWSVVHKTAEQGKLALQRIADIVPRPVDLCAPRDIPAHAAVAAVFRLVPEVVCGLIEHREWQGVKAAGPGTDTAIAM